MVASFGEIGLAIHDPSFALVASNVRYARALIQTRIIDSSLSTSIGFDR